jgi:5-methylcytosine-specific restriction endonuclease McrA
VKRAPGSCNQPGCPNAPIYRGRCAEHVRWNNLSPRQRGRALMAQRERALRAGGKRCQQCAAPPPLELHHRDGDVTNNQPDNLRLLCRDCHRVAVPPQLQLSGVR